MDRRANEETTKDLASLEVWALEERADKGDQVALQTLKEQFGVLFDQYASMRPFAREADGAQLKLVSGEHLVLRESIRRELDNMRRELAGVSPTPLESLLVDRVVACWLQLRYAETIYAQNLARLTLVQADYHQKRIDRAHKRYLTAIRTLAVVRRLQVPTLQVNIGEKQVNVAG